MFLRLDIPEGRLRAWNSKIGKPNRAGFSWVWLVTCVPLCSLNLVLWHKTFWKLNKTEVIYCITNKVVARDTDNDVGVENDCCKFCNCIEEKVGKEDVLRVWCSSTNFIPKVFYVNHPLSKNRSIQFSEIYSKLLFIYVFRYHSAFIIFIGSIIISFDLLFSLIYLVRYPSAFIIFIGPIIISFDLLFNFNCVTNYYQ